MSNTDAQSMSADAFFGSTSDQAATPAPEPAAQPTQMQPIEAFFAPAPTEQQPVPPAPVLTPPEASPQPAQQHQVPVAHLVEERRARQAAERERSELLQAVARLTAQQQPQPQAPQPVRPQIDPVADPEGAYHALRSEMHEAVLNQHLNMSERYARSAHGQEVVDQALQAAVQAGATEFFRTRQDPYGEMVNWFRGQQLSQEIGSDPVAYRAKIEAELTAKVQAEVLARLQAGRTPPTNLPPSLAQGTNAAAATAQVVPDGRSFFSSMMSKRPSQ